MGSEAQGGFLQWSPRSYSKEAEDQQCSSGLGFCLIFRTCILLEWVKQSHAMGVAPRLLFLSSNWIKSHFIEAFSLINSKAIS